jgi:hypothetical protein
LNIDGRCRPCCYTEAHAESNERIDAAGAAPLTEFPIPGGI